MIYATCSLLPEENEGVAQAFSLAQPDFQPLDAAAELTRLKVPQAERLVSGAEPARCLRLWPHQHGTDGFFAALWQRKG